MDRLLALYQKLSQAGTKFYMWDLNNDKAVPLEVGGAYGIFMDFDILPEMRLLSLLTKAAMRPQGPRIRYVVHSI